MPDQVTTLLADGLRRVEESISRLSTDLHTQLSRLPELYLTQREAERRFADYKIDIEALDLKVGREGTTRSDAVRELTDLIKAVEEQRKSDERQRQADRRWLIATLLTVVGLAVAVLSLMARTA